MKRLMMALAVVVACSTPGMAHKFEKDGIAIKHPWTRATAPGAAVGVGYLTITNTGKEPDTMTGGTFEGAGNVEIHEMKMDGDKMLMRQLKDGLEIKPGETVKFSPGGYHLMFTGLKTPIAQGPNIKGSLTFKNAGTIDVTYKVESIGAMTSGDGDHGAMKMDGTMKMDDTDMKHEHAQ
ncbi:copper chaperone PCu(A)C [Hyphomicrobium sp. B1]|jgi:copper(I)-binding protein|uniref:copper chaperone PCu(A)C n=1 Tax=Hyphomicrobium sp. B1 TaxID=3075651 RepID=UPI003C2F5109